MMGWETLCMALLAREINNRIIALLPLLLPVVVKTGMIMGTFEIMVNIRAIRRMR